MSKSVKEMSKEIEEHKKRNETLQKQVVGLEGKIKKLDQDNKNLWEAVTRYQNISSALSHAYMEVVNNGGQKILINWRQVGSDWLIAKGPADELSLAK